MQVIKDIVLFEIRSNLIVDIEVKFVNKKTDRDSVGTISLSTERKCPMHFYFFQEKKLVSTLQN